MQIQDALESFLLQLQADGRSLHTISQYRRHGAALANWLAKTGCPTTIASLDPPVLARFLAAEDARTSCRGGPKKAVSLNALRTSIRCFAKHLHDAGLVAANPARLLRRARCTPPPPKALFADEQTRLVAVLNAATGPEADRDKMLVELLLGTGIRIGSAIALDVEDVDFEHSEVSVRRNKNDRPATAVLPGDVTKKLRAFVGNRTAGPVFLAGNRRICIRHAQRRLAGWFKAAGIAGSSAHSLRHTFATSLLARTGNLRLVQTALNHASIVSTTIYAQVDRASLRTAINS